MTEHEEGRVGAGGDEPEGADVHHKTLVPRSWGLTQAIEGFIKETQIVWMLDIDKTGGLLAVHRFLELAVQECIADIQLVNGPLVRRGECEDRTDGGWLDDGRERLAGRSRQGALNVTTQHPPSFAPFEGAVGVEFVLEHPFAGDNANAEWVRHQTPHLVAQKGIMFGLHCMAPAVITQSNED